MKITPKNEVLLRPAAAPEDALEHFERSFAFETDCWDVHSAMESNPGSFVVLDVRSRELYDAGHVPGAVHFPHWRITAERLAEYGEGTLFVVYCAGPHCNGAKRGAIRLARIGRPVKEMVGGIEGWKDEGFELETA